MTSMKQQILERLVAIELETLASLTPHGTIDAKPYSIYQQESFPYLTQRAGNTQVTPDSEDRDVYEVDVMIRIVIGHVTQGYAGESEQLLYDLEAALMHAINERELLQSAAYPVALTGLTSARAEGSTGMVIVDQAGIQARQVGAQITVTVTYTDDITQQYL